MVETEADLASMFVAGEFAEAALYQSPVPGRAPAPCSVIVDRGQGRERLRSGEQETKVSERQLLVRRAQLAAVARDGVFAMLDGFGAATGERFKVADLPELDQTARVWSVDLTMLGSGLG